MRVSFLVAVIAAGMLTGCDDIPRARTEGEIQNIAYSAARDVQSPLDERVKALEAEIADLKASQERDRKFSVDTYNDLNNLRDTFNRNVRIDNENAIRRMTARGACGTERVNYTNGSWSWRNKECTLKDLR